VVAYVVGVADDVVLDGEAEVVVDAVLGVVDVVDVADDVVDVAVVEFLW